MESDQLHVPAIFEYRAVSSDSAGWLQRGRGGVWTCARVHVCAGARACLEAGIAWGQLNLEAILKCERMRRWML